MRSVFILLLFIFMVGCGSGGSTSPPTPIPTPPPPDVLIESAKIEACSALFLYRTPSDVVFTVSGTVFNDGEADLANAYYMVQGDSLFSWKWSNLQTPTPFNLPRGTSFSFTTEVEHSLVDMIGVTGSSFPVNYQLRIELRAKDGNVLDSKLTYVTVI